MRRTLTVSPTVQTEALAAQAGLFSRQTPNGIRVFYELQRLETLQHLACNTQEAVQLGFKLDTADHLFAHYTEPGCPADSLFYFEPSCTRMASADIDCLHRQAQVSCSEIEQIESPRVDALLTPAERVTPPLGVISVPLMPSTRGLFDEQFNVMPRTYQICFAARKTYWTYYLLGQLAKEGVYIEDAKGETSFDALGEVILPGNQVAQAFRTTSMLPFQDRYHLRFQIVDPGAEGDRILIARLPGAQVRQAYYERLYGAEEAVSDIFIQSP